MSFLTLNPETYEIDIEPEALLLAPIKSLYKKDKTKDKRHFKNEMAFIYFYANAKSDYLFVTNEKERASKIMTDLEMEDKGTISKELAEAIEFYKEFRTINEELYFGATTAAGFVNEKLKNANELLERVDERTGKPIYTLKDITSAIQQVPAIMKNLKAAYSEVVLEQKTTEGKKKGSQGFNLFEDGLNIGD